MGKKRSVEAEPMQRAMLESVRCDVEERLLQIDWHCVYDVRTLYGFIEDLEF